MVRARAIFLSLTVCTARSLASGVLTRCAFPKNPRYAKVQSRGKQCRRTELNSGANVLRCRRSILQETTGRYGWSVGCPGNILELLANFDWLLLLLLLLL
uniref:Putative secreted peptide n=1 Tax=Anopheles braziliensis TaxID=58242 RepID=A0A2M3ZMS7_9DIPT